MPTHFRYQHDCASTVKCVIPYGFVHVERQACSSFLLHFCLPLLLATISQLYYYDTATLYEPRRVACRAKKTSVERKLDFSEQQQGPAAPPRPRPPSLLPCDVPAKAPSRGATPSAGDTPVRQQSSDATDMSPTGGHAGERGSWAVIDSSEVAHASSKTEGEQKTSASQPTPTSKAGAQDKPQLVSQPSATGSPVPVVAVPVDMAAPTSTSQVAQPVAAKPSEQPADGSGSSAPAVAVPVTQPGEQTCVRAEPVAPPVVEAAPTDTAGKTAKSPVPSQPTTPSPPQAAENAVAATPEPEPEELVAAPPSLRFPFAVRHMEFCQQSLSLTLSNEMSSVLVCQFKPVNATPDVHVSN